MPLTDRFIKLPIKVFDSAHKSLTGKEEISDVMMRINPMDISYWYPGVYDDYAKQGDFIVMGTKGGDRTTIYLSPKEFEKVLNDSQK